MVPNEPQVFYGTRNAGQAFFTWLPLSETLDPWPACSLSR